MTNSEARDIIFATAECEARQDKCDKNNCDECQLLYMQGTVKEHREALSMAIQALENQYNESVKGDLISRSFVLSVIKHFQNMQSWNEEAKFSEILRKIEEEQPTVGNDGWIPVSSGNPKETGLYQVTVDDNDEPVITAMYLAEVDTWSYHAGYGNYMKVLAWRELPQPYKENEK